MIGVWALFGRTQSTPCDQKSRPSGSTSHQLPSTFSTRKKPVALAAARRSQPPYWFQSPGPGCEARSAASFAMFAFSSSTVRTLPGQSACLYCPNVSMIGKNFSGDTAPFFASPVADDLADDELMIGSLAWSRRAALRDVARIDALFRPAVRIAAHAEELVFHGGGHGPIERHDERLRIARLDVERRGDAMVLAVGTGLSTRHETRTSALPVFFSSTATRVNAERSSLPPGAFSVTPGHFSLWPVVISQLRLVLGERRVGRLDGFLGERLGEIEEGLFGGR